MKELGAVLYSTGLKSRLSISTVYMTVAVWIGCLVYSQPESKATNKNCKYFCFLFALGLFLIKASMLLFSPLEG